MFLLNLPVELLQLIIDLAVEHTDLQRAVRFRETCRMLFQDSSRTPNLTDHRPIR
jgi:hypothetical protein